jgi:L-aspartate oxidase
VSKSNSLMAIHQTDVLVVGSGLAGLAVSLKLSKARQVLLLAKETVSQTNTSWAQGGIAAVMSKSDSFESHIQDTLNAGAGLCRQAAVEDIVRQAPDRIQDLLDWGADLDPQDLTREGGHSSRRILHFEDHTGSHLQDVLTARVRENNNIQIRENIFAIDLILNRQVNPQSVEPLKCVGIYGLNRVTHEVDIYLANEVILATGGAGKVYRYTSNWSGATGDGIAMAYRAGARVANLEFMQFHPTCLYHREARNFLISEALRGEGGELINSQGVAFMKKQHPMGSLAPRDIVARLIDAEMKKTGAPCVYLDMTKLASGFAETRFPAIHQKCLEYGIDMRKDPIPVVPAAHYLCGGVVTDLAGQTDILNLWALGETACTGLHGANRLASNSLLECLAMAENCFQRLKDLKPSLSPDLKPPEWIHPDQKDDDEMIVIHHMWDEIRALMWNYVGIVRSNKRLTRAQHRLTNIMQEVKEYYSNFRLHPDILELRNIAIVARLTVECALNRKESRGIHYSLDYPFEQGTEENTLFLPPARDTILLSSKFEY